MCSLIFIPCSLAIESVFLTKCTALSPQGTKLIDFYSLQSSAMSVFCISRTEWACWNHMGARFHLFLAFLCGHIDSLDALWYRAGVLRWLFSLFSYSSGVVAYMNLRGCSLNTAQILFFPPNSLHAFKTHITYLSAKYTKNYEERKKLHWN